MNFMHWGGFGQVIWGGYGHCKNPPPPKCPIHSSLKSIQILPESLSKCIKQNSQPAIVDYHVTMVQIFVTSNLSIQICSIDTRDER